MSAGISRFRLEIFLYNGQLETEVLKLMENKLVLIIGPEQQIYFILTQRFVLIAFLTKRFF